MNASTSIHAAGLAAALLLLIAGGALAQSTTEWKAPDRAARVKNPVATSAESVASGKELYAANCFVCHGTTGAGDGPAASGLERKPGNLSSSELWKQTDGALFWKITTGKAPMPVFGEALTPEQRWNIINYVRTLAPKPAE